MRRSCGLVNGSWQITAHPWDATASAVIWGTTTETGRHVRTWPSAPRAVIWNAAGSFTVLGCTELGEAYGLSSGAQVVVGTYRSAASAIAVVWRPGQCRETLPPLIAGGGGDAYVAAYAVNGDGTIVGGSSGVPVRWRRVNSSWQVEQLDNRQGLVFGANSAGDLVGAVGSACSPSPAGCSLDISIGGTRMAARVSPTPAVNTAQAINWQAGRESPGERERVPSLVETLASGSGVEGGMGVHDQRRARRRPAWSA
jgi:uncharacterized membrane protein